MIGNIDKLILSGKYDNGNHIDIYTSGITFETNYTYLRSESIKISMTDVYTSGAMSSIDHNACDHMHQWMQSLKRTANLITNSEKNRIQFLEKQLKAIDDL